MKKIYIIVLALVLAWPVLGQVSTPISITSSLVVSWQAAASANSYTVKRSLVSGGPYTVIATGITAVTYVDVAVGPKTTYYYVIDAVNTIGSSPDSAEAQATTP